MAVIEYRAIVAKAVYKDNGEVHVTHAVEGGKTVRMIYGGDATLLSLCETVRLDHLQIEDKPKAEPWTPWVVKKEGA